MISEMFMRSCVHLKNSQFDLILNVHIVDSLIEIVRIQFNGFILIKYLNKSIELNGK